jgi:hypothetical protein
MRNWEQLLLLQLQQATNSSKHQHALACSSTTRSSRACRRRLQLLSCSSCSVSAQVFYHLGELDSALTYALGAGAHFNVDEQSEYVQTLIGERREGTAWHTRTRGVRRWWGLCPLAYTDRPPVADATLCTHVSPHPPTTPSHRALPGPVV